MTTKRRKFLTGGMGLLALSVRPGEGQLAQATDPALEPEPVASVAALSIPFAPAPGTWKAVPNSALWDQHQFPPEYYAFPTQFGSGPASLTGSWVSGAFDEARLEFGLYLNGGHNNWYGNESHRYRLATATWERMDEVTWNPTTHSVPDWQTAWPGEYPASLAAQGFLRVPKPVSRHNLDGVQFMTGIGRAAVWGGILANFGAQGVETNVRLLDPATRLWARGGRYAGGGNFTTCYDFVSGWLIGRRIHDALILGYNPTAGTVATLGMGLFNSYYYFTSAFCPLDNSMYCFGGPSGARITRIQLRPTVQETIVSGLTGAIEFADDYAPGVAWHPGRQSFVIWVGGRNLYVFNPLTKICTRETLGGDDPGEPETNGTFGRFRYCATADTFILVNKVLEPVLYARLPGAASPRIDLTVPAGRTVSVTRRTDDASPTVTITVNRSDQLFVNGVLRP